MSMPIPYGLELAKTVETPKVDNVHWSAVGRRDFGCPVRSVPQKHIRTPSVENKQLYLAW